MDMTKHVGSNLYNADKIPTGLKIEETIAYVELRQFEDGEKPVAVFESGRAVVLNPTRGQALVDGLGRDSDNWTGQAVYVSRGQTMYSGKTVGCVVVEAVTPIRIATQPAAKPALEGQRQAPATNVLPMPARGTKEIGSGPDRWAKYEEPPAPTPEAGDGPDPGDPVPF
jgi:hypothetical protein